MNTFGLIATEVIYTYMDVRHTVNLKQVNTMNLTTNQVQINLNTVKVPINCNTNVLTASRSSVNKNKVNING